MKKYNITEKIPGGYKLVLTTHDKKEAMTTMKTNKKIYKERKFYLTIVNE